METSTDPFNVNLTKSAQEVVEDTKADENVEAVEEQEEENDDDEIVTSPEQTADVPDESDEEDDSSEVEFEGRTGSSLMAEAYKNEGLLPEDFEVTDDLKSKDLFTALSSYAREQARVDVEDEMRQKGYSDQVFEYVDYLAKGGSPEVVQQHNIYDRLANYEPTNEEDSRELVKAMLQDKQMDDDLIEDTLESLEVNEKLDQQAKKASQYFGQKRDEFFNQQKKIADEQKKAYEDQIKQQEDNFRKIISKGEIGELKLSKNEAKELEKAFLDRNEVVVQTLPNGEKQKVKITKFEKLMNEIRQDPEKTLQFAYMVLNGTDGIKNRVSSEVREEFLNTLDAKKKFETVSETKPKPKRKNVFQDYADSKPLVLRYN